MAEQLKISGQSIIGFRSGSQRRAVFSRYAIPRTGESLCQPDFIRRKT